MMSDTNSVIPLDAQVGGDGDNGGISQTITRDDIDATLHSPAQLETRREQLKAMRSDLQARMSADRGEEFGPLIENINQALSALDGTVGTEAPRSALGADEQDRSDALPPGGQQV